jgi:hypothetical protein
MTEEDIRHERLMRERLIDHVLSVPDNSCERYMTKLDIALQGTEFTVQGDEWDMNAVTEYQQPAKGTH